MEKRERGRCNDCCPYRHAGSSYFVEELQSMFVDIDSCKVEEDLPLGGGVEL